VCSSVFTRTFKEGRIMMDIIKSIEAEQIRKDLPQFNVGDTIQVFYKVTEGSRERIQVFEGTVLKIQGEGSRKTFTVRRISYGIGVERTFPINSPRIDKITVVRKGKVRRAKLYYLRDRQGKSAKVKEKRFY
jgi:large subunit ribosomal protein L19